MRAAESLSYTVKHIHAVFVRCRNVRTVNSTHKFSFHYWCQGALEVFNLMTDPLQLKNLASDPESDFGRIAVSQAKDSRALVELYASAIVC